MNTLHKRTITLTLTDYVLENLAKKAGAVDMTIGELLSGFAADLVGNYLTPGTHGSDERIYANAWFDRCGFETFAEKSFLRWLLIHDGVESFLGDYLEMIACEKDVTEADSQEELENAAADLEYYKGEVDDYYKQYTKFAAGSPEPFEVATKRVLEWQMELDKLKED